MIPMNMFKKNGGFTLVELIVVIAILAILAGVAVPAYSGYIGKANEAADTTALSAVKTACQAALATKGEVTAIEVTATGIKVVYTDNAGATQTIANILSDTDTVGTDFKTFYGSAVPDLETGDKATWPASATDSNWKIETTTNP